MIGCPCYCTFFSESEFPSNCDTVSFNSVITGIGGVLVFTSIISTEEEESPCMNLSLKASYSLEVFESLSPKPSML